jgi:hypothetical protein
MECLPRRHDYVSSDVQESVSSLFLPFQGTAKPIHILADEDPYSSQAGMENGAKEDLQVLEEETTSKEKGQMTGNEANTVSV